MSHFEGFDVPKENWSKLPHDFISALPEVETIGELKVILYILRHTWGFQDTRKKITLDEFENGRKRRDGTRLDNGVGLSRPTVINGLDRAEKHGFIVVEKDERDKARIKKFYSLRMLKNFTPGVKKLDTEGKETLHRSEKETLERNLEKESGANAPSPSSGPSEQEQSTETPEPPPAAAPSVYTDGEIPLDEAVEACKQVADKHALFDESDVAAGLKAIGICPDCRGSGEFCGCNAEAPSQNVSERENGEEEDKSLQNPPTNGPGTRTRAPTGRNAVKAVLQDYFCEVTGLPGPALNNAKQRRAAGAAWFGPLLEIAGWVDDDVDEAKRLIGLAVGRLRVGEMTIGAPRSVVNTARAVMGEINSGVDPTGAKDLFESEGVLRPVTESTPLW